MSFKDYISKNVNQLKAVSPDYDVCYEHSEASPIKFNNPQEVLLSFACIADTHLPDRDSAEHNLENLFKDIAISQNPFDAVLVAGDIADYGLAKEYARFFRVFDKHKNAAAPLLTIGNHDARLFYKKNTNIVMKKIEEYLSISTHGKSYYSFDIKGYTFIVLATDKRVFEKAYISPEQISFLDSQLKRATANGQPAFVMCHQAFAFTHGLPEVWKTGDMGPQSQLVRDVMEKYKNVFFINGHLHGGIFEKTFETLNEANNVISISIPGYRKINNFGIKDCGVGYYVLVYSHKIEFIARNFLKGEDISGDYTHMEYHLK